MAAEKKLWRSALDFEGQIKKKLYHRNKRVDWHGTKRMCVDRMLDPSCGFKLWPHPWPWPLIFKVKFYEKVDWLGTREMWVGYRVEQVMGLLLGHSAWQIHWTNNGSMWNSYTFQPVGSWMGYSFTDLWGWGCCRYLNALFIKGITGFCFAFCANVKFKIQCKFTTRFGRNVSYGQLPNSFSRELNPPPLWRPVTPFHSLMDESQWVGHMGDLLQYIFF